jgi:hypothetical protein
MTVCSVNLISHINRRVNEPCSDLKNQMKTLTGITGALVQNCDMRGAIDIGG